MAAGLAERVTSKSLCRLLTTCWICPVIRLDQHLRVADDIGKQGGAGSGNPRTRRLLPSNGRDWLVSAHTVQRGNIEEDAVCATPTRMKRDEKEAHSRGDHKRRAVERRKGIRMKRREGSQERGGQRVKGIVMLSGRYGNIGVGSVVEVVEKRMQV